MSLKNLSQLDVVLFKIVARDELGRVRHVEVVYDHESVDLRDPNNREFMTAFVERGLMARLNGAAWKKKGGN